MDKIDRRIVAELRRNARVTVTELAARVGVSKTPCQNRIKRLERDGYLRGYTALVDHGKLGQGHVAFVQVHLSDTTEKALQAFNAAVRDVPSVEQCHMIAGGFDYLLKVRSADIVEYRKTLGETIACLPHVSHTSTFVAMESVKDGAA
ncbi:MAG: Lrp/AsnC ligand binding domain-containing protein [Rhodospirillales bacterium]